MIKPLKFTAKQLYIASLINFLPILFIGCKYLKYTENISGFLSYFYLGASVLGHFFLINSIPLLLSLILLYAFKSPVLTKIIFCFLTILTIVYLQIDILVYRQFRYHLSPIVFKLVFGKRATDIFQFSSVNIIISVAYISALSLWEVFVLFISKKLSEKSKNLRVRITLSVVFFCLICTHLLFAWSDANRYRAIAQMKNVYPAFFPLTAESLLRKWNLVDEKEIERNTLLSRSYSKDLIKYPLNPIVSENNGKKNILFIVIDSWRFDCLDEQIIPHIYQFSKQSQVFKNHKSSSNMTTGGIFSLFYAIPATYYDQFTGLEISPVFFDELQKQNYELSILSSSTLENPPFNKNVFSGIKNLRLESNGNSSAERDKDVYNEWMKFMDARSSDTTQPFFSFLFFDSAHGFDYPSDFPIKFKPTLNEVNYLALEDTYDPLPFFNRYKNSLNYIDTLVGGVLRKLKEKELLESTIVVVTGDHGQEFNDNKKGYWQHGGNFSDYQIATPLIVYDFSQSPKTYTHLTLHYDIIPTLMSSIMGVKNDYKDYSVGQNLYNTKNRNWFICGYNQKYAIVQKNKIINIYQSGAYEVVNKNLNPLDESEIDFTVVEEAIKENSQFYNISVK
jgi:membrane-anchored protein YejM (alkaline phosphatase superfamily)